MRYNVSFGSKVNREQLIIDSFVKFQERMIELYGLLLAFSSKDDPLIDSTISLLITLHNETSLMVTFYDEERGIFYKKQALSRFNQVVDLLNRLKISLLPQSDQYRQIDYMLKLILELEKYTESF